MSCTSHYGGNTETRRSVIPEPCWIPCNRLSCEFRDQFEQLWLVSPSEEHLHVPMEAACKLHPSIYRALINFFFKCFDAILLLFTSGTGKYCRTYLTLVSSSGFVAFTVHDSKWLLLPLPGRLKCLAVIPSTSTSVKKANWLGDP